MRLFSSLSLALLLGLLALAAPPAAVAQTGPNTCSATLTIATTGPGTVTQHGDILQARRSGVGGAYLASTLNGAAGALDGATFSGAQDVTVNTRTGRADLHGSYLVTAPGGTFTVTYNGRADLTTGKAIGNFIAKGGTGAWAHFTWSGAIAAQLIGASPPTFLTADTGICYGVPA